VDRGAAYHERDRAEGQVDAYRHSNLVQLLRRLGPASGVRRDAEAFPRREEEMQVEQHHDDAQAHHQVDVERQAGEAAEGTEDHPEAADEQSHDRRADPRQEPREHPPP
jgi:hypothetical protein